MFEKAKELQFGSVLEAGYLADYMARLNVAGYNQQFRVRVLRQVVARYNGMVQVYRAGKQPMYRSKQ